MSELILFSFEGPLWRFITSFILFSIFEFDEFWILFKNRYINF